MPALNRHPHIVVGTPGRIVKHITKTKNFKIGSIRKLILDEADRFFDQDFSEDHDTCVSSVYFDNTKFELYNGRLRKLQGAEAIRIRWYGAHVPDVVFVERKRHEESWTGERSKKLRFRMHEKDVVDYINGGDVWPGVKALNGEEVAQLYREIQAAILNKGLRPMVRTFYRRNAFQLPNNASVRISLDTNLTMIKECSDDAYGLDEFPLTQWRRPDAACEWPFPRLGPSKTIFPRYSGNKNPGRRRN